MNIKNFKQNDVITRVEPAKSLGLMMTMTGQAIERGGDRSYMGDKLIFKGIANGQIYLQRTNKFELEHFGSNISVALDLWDEGWQEWIDPETITGIVFSNEEIQKQIQDAIDEENYELAEKLKASLK